MSPFLSVDRKGGIDQNPDGPGALHGAAEGAGNDGKDEPIG